MYASRTRPGRSIDAAEPWLSAGETAAHLGITKDAVYDWIAHKKMPAHRVGRLWKFQVGEIDEWVRSGCAGPEAKHKGGDA